MPRWVFEVWDVDDILMPLNRQAAPQRFGGGGRSLLPDVGSGGDLPPLWEYIRLLI